MPNLTFLAPTVPEIWLRGSRNFKSRSRDPFSTCQWGRGSPVTRYLFFWTPICLFII